MTRGALPDEGKRLRALPLPPRLARMVLSAARLGEAQHAAEIAAVLVERGIGGNDSDLVTRLENFRRDRSRRADDLRRLARGWADNAASQKDGRARGGHSTAALLALAYPDRIAKARGAPGQFLLANGRAGQIDITHPLARAPYLVVAELQGRAAATRILLAASVDEAEVLEIAQTRITARDELTFDASALAVRARRVRRLDAIMFSSEQRAVTPSDEVAGVLADGIAAQGIGEIAVEQSAAAVAPARRVSGGGRFSRLAGCFGRGVGGKRRTRGCSRFYRARQSWQRSVLTISAMHSMCCCRGL